MNDKPALIEPQKSDAEKVVPVKIETLAQRKKREHKAKAAKPGSPAFFTGMGERPDAAADGKLFADNLVVESLPLVEGWTGWESCGMMGKEKYFRGQAYFDWMIKNGNYKDEDAAKKDAENLFNTGTMFLLAGADGDDLDNTFVRLYGMTDDVFQKTECAELYKILKRCWTVGNAQSVHKVKKALFKLAADGNLDAQRTILTQSGDLTPGGTVTDAEGFTMIIDQEDLNA